MKKLNLKVADTEPKRMKNGEVDKRYTMGPKTEFVGKVFECVFDSFLVLEELPKVLSKNGKYVYRNFRVQCQKCGTERQTLAASLNAKGVACPVCRKEKRGVKVLAYEPPVNIEQKIQIMSEINQIWDEMKRLQRMGELTKYLVKKFNAPEWLLDEETEHVTKNNDMDDSDDIDYTDDNIDWDDEIKKYL